MTSHIVDSAFFKDFYGTEAMRRVFSDENLLQKWLDVEASLAKAEGMLGIIPEWASEEIASKAKAENIDIQRMKGLIDETVHPIVPLIKELERVCGGEAGHYIHWGATTQDIMDTAVALQLKEAYKLLLTDLRRLEDVLVELAVRYRDTVMPGRTHGQQALPITFGFKVAVWLSEVHRHVERLLQSEERVLVGQLSGAVGTLASLGTAGMQVQELMMKELGLRVPSISWHAARDGFAEFTGVLGMLAATLQKIANEVATLQKTEIAELEEPFEMGKVGSSTMPHKRNPMLCEALIATAMMARSNVGLALEAMVHEHERDMGPWQAEWGYLPEACVTTAGALNLALRVLSGLRVNEDKMTANLYTLDGLMMSEAVMLRLAESIGRQRAHDVVYAHSMRAFEEGRPLREVLEADAEVTARLSARELDELLDPRSYVGLAGQFVDRVVNGVRSARRASRQNENEAVAPVRAERGASTDRRRNQGGQR